MTVSKMQAPPGFNPSPYILGKCVSLPIDSEQTMHIRSNYNHLALPEILPPPVLSGPRRPFFPSYQLILLSAKACSR